TVNDPRKRVYAPGAVLSREPSQWPVIAPTGPSSEYRSGSAKVDGPSKFSAWSRSTQVSPWRVPNTAAFQAPGEAKPHPVGPTGALEATRVPEVTPVYTRGSPGCGSALDDEDDVPRDGLELVDPDPQAASRVAHVTIPASPRGSRDTSRIIRRAHR